MNMSYCRFENTYADLQDCAEAIENRDELNELSPTEARYRNRLIELCREIVIMADEMNDDEED